MCTLKKEGTTKNVKNLYVGKDFLSNLIHNY